MDGSQSLGRSLELFVVVTLADLAMAAYANVLIYLFCKYVLFTQCLHFHTLAPTHRDTLCYLFMGSLA